MDALVNTAFKEFLAQPGSNLVSCGLQAIRAINDKIYKDDRCATLRQSRHAYLLFHASVLPQKLSMTVSHWTSTTSEQLHFYRVTMCMLPVSDGVIIALKK